MVAKSQFFLKNLLTGINDFVATGSRYPYPDKLTDSMNLLCLEMDNFPKTITGFMILIQKPLKDWCPAKLIPEDFDESASLIKAQEGNFSLLTIELTESAKNYLG